MSGDAPGRPFSRTRSRTAPTKRRTSAGQLLRADDADLGHLLGEQFPHQLGAVDGALEQCLAVAHELSPRAVDAREQEHRGARGLLDVVAQLQPLEVDPIGSDGYDGRLAQPRQRLVHRPDGQVGAAREGALREIGVPAELVVEPPRVIGDERQVALVRGVPGSQPICA
jgi:hypothetical protein